MQYGFNEHLRQTHNQLRLATVKEIDWEKRLFRAQSGDLETNWLAVPAYVSHNFRAWFPLREQMQVVLLVAGGDYNTAVVVGVLWCDTVPAPDIPEDQRRWLDLIEFNDGSKIEYDSQRHRLTIKCIDQINLESESLTHNGINIGATHRHSGVKPGGGQSGGPQ